MINPALNPMRMLAEELEADDVRLLRLWDEMVGNAVATDTRSSEKPRPDAEHLIRFTEGEWISLRGRIDQLRYVRMNEDEDDTSDVACVLDGLRRATKGMQ